MPEDEVIVKKLMEEKKLLENKVKNLAQILELTSNQEGKAAQSNDISNSEEKLKVHFRDLKKSLNSIIKKVEEAGKSRPKEADIEKMKAGIETLERRTKELDKLPDIESRIKKFEELSKPKDGKSLFGGFQEPSSKTGGVRMGPGFQEHLDEIRNDFGSKISSLNKRVDSLMSKLMKRQLTSLKRWFLLRLIWKKLFLAWLEKR